MLLDLEHMVQDSCIKGWFEQEGLAKENCLLIFRVSQYHHILYVTGLLNSCFKRPGIKNK